MRSITAGVVIKLHDVIRDTIKEIKSGDDAEAANMADVWFNKVEESNFEDVNFNTDIYEAMLKNKKINAEMSYFTFRNHFISKVLKPIREKILNFLVEQDNSLKHDREELDWLTGLLKNYVTISNTQRAIAVLRNQYANKTAELLQCYKWVNANFAF